MLVCLAPFLTVIHRNAAADGGLSGGVGGVGVGVGVGDNDAHDEDADIIYTDYNNINSDYYHQSNNNNNSSGGGSGDEPWEYKREDACSFFNINKWVNRRENYRFILMGIPRASEARARERNVLQRWTASRHGDGGGGSGEDAAIREEREKKKRLQAGER